MYDSRKCHASVRLANGLDFDVSAWNVGDLSRASASFVVGDGTGARGRVGMVDADTPAAAIAAAREQARERLRAWLGAV